MSKLFVKIKSHRVRDYWDGEQYGDWETEDSYEGCQVLMLADGEIGYQTSSIEVDFKPEVGQVVFPVIVSHGTGDTFGHSSGNAKCVAVVDTPEKAHKIREAIEEDYRNNSGGYGHIDVDGLEIYTYDWKGYFECLEWVRVETEIVQA